MLAARIVDVVPVGPVDRDDEGSGLTDVGLCETLAHDGALGRDVDRLEAHADAAPELNNPVEESGGLGADHLAEEPNPADVVGRDNRIGARPAELGFGGRLDRLGHDTGGRVERARADRDEKIGFVVVERRDHAAGAIDARQL